MEVSGSPARSISIRERAPVSYRDWGISSAPSKPASLIKATASRLRKGYSAPVEKSVQGFFHHLLLSGGRASWRAADWFVNA